MTGSLGVNPHIDSSTLTITSTQGSVTSLGTVAIFGRSPTIVAAGEVRVNVEGNKGPIAILAGKDIVLNTVKKTEDASMEIGGVQITEISGPANNLQTYQVLGVQSSGGDVYINAPDGIVAQNASSLVKGDLVELHAEKGGIGAGNLMLGINTDVLGLGGLAARAEDGIYLKETVGDLKLAAPESWGTSGTPEPSVHSLAGNVRLDTVSGSITDAIYEQLRPRTAEEAAAIDAQQQLTQDAARDCGAGVNPGRGNQSHPGLPRLLAHLPGCGKSDAFAARRAVTPIIEKARPRRSTSPPDDGHDQPVEEAGDLSKLDGHRQDEEERQDPRVHQARDLRRLHAPHGDGREGERRRPGDQEPLEQERADDRVMEKSAAPADHDDYRLSTADCRLRSAS